jgi:hypothetical protein
MAEHKRIRKTGFFVHLTEEELAILKEKATAARMSRTEFIRSIILFGSARGNTNFSAEDADRLQFELNRIGNNINQLAYQANSKRSTGAHETAQMAEEFRRLLAQFESFVIG